MYKLQIPANKAQNSWKSPMCLICRQILHNSTSALEGKSFLKGWRQKFSNSGDLTLYFLHWCQNQAPANQPSVCQAQRKDPGSTNWEEKTPWRGQPLILLACFPFSKERAEAKSSELWSTSSVQLLKRHCQDCKAPERVWPSCWDSKLENSSGWQNPEIWEAKSESGLAVPQCWTPRFSFRHLQSGLINTWSLSGSYSEKCVRDLHHYITR